MAGQCTSLENNESSSIGIPERKNILKNITCILEVNSDDQRRLLY